MKAGGVISGHQSVPSPKAGPFQLWLATPAQHDRLPLIMKTATVADLRNNFSSVSKWIHNGEAVTITKRGLQFATLIPARKRKALAPIDRWARLRKMFPHGPVKGEVQDVLTYDRGDT
jgi:prevent-host-death family protein